MQIHSVKSKKKYLKLIDLVILNQELKKSWIKRENTLKICKR